MKVIGWKQGAQEVQISLSQGMLFFRRHSENILRCVYTKEEAVKELSPLEIISASSVAPKGEETEREIVVETKELRVKVCKESGRCVWESKTTGELLLSEGDKELTQQPVLRYSTNGEAPIIDRVKTVDGERNFVKNLRPTVDRQAYRGKLHFEWQEDEVLHGLGQGEEGIYNYRGQTQYLYQHNMRIPVPFLVSNKKYGLLADCGSLMTFNDDCRGSYMFFDTIDQMDYYVIYGETMDDIVDGFRRLTGQAVMLPKWAFGYIQSKEAYLDQQELVDTVKEYRRRKVPLDCIVQDWLTWEEGKWGNKRVDKKRYPDLAEANREIHEMHVHTMVSIWPNMNSGTENYEEFMAAGEMLNDLATYNAFSPRARELYWKQANEELFSGGFDSWWCDSTEPFSGPDWGGEYLREPWERFQIVGTEHKKYLDPVQANLYAVAHAQGIYENQRKENPNKRVLNLTRSGYAGSQRYATVLWSGDTCATWGNYKKQITEGLNFCLSGMPYWTLDIGAFFTVNEVWENRGCNCNQDPLGKWFWKGDYETGAEDLGYRELYVRWFQYGTFLPVFRSHGTDTPRELWNFGEPGEIFYDTLDKFIRLRYRLMPYIYSLAGKVTKENYTMMRSLLFDYPNDEIASEMETQFMLGDSLLICPVTKPMYYGQNSKPLSEEPLWSCYLPAGNEWYDFWTGERMAGGRWITADAALDKMPVFVRAGSIIPMEQGLQYASQEVDTPMEFHIYRGADASFSLYEDCGDDYGYEEGICNRIPLTWKEETGEFTMGEAPYSFPQSIKGRSCCLMVGAVSREFRYEGKFLSVKIEKSDIVF